jgi:hypothetical protein
MRFCRRTAPDALLIERDAEIARLGAAIDAGVAGDGQVLVIDGPAGIGKTALLDVARSRASGAGIAVLHARGHELEGHLPYGVVRQLFEPVLRDASAAARRRLLAGAAGLAAAIVAPDGRAGADRDSDVGVFAVTHGLYWLTVNLSSQAPVMIAVDDVHWADGPSLRFLRYGRWRRSHDRVGQQRPVGSRRIGDVVAQDLQHDRRGPGVEVLAHPANDLVKAAGDERALEPIAAAADRVRFREPLPQP